MLIGTRAAPASRALPMRLHSTNPSIAACVFAALQDRPGSGAVCSRTARLPLHWGKVLSPQLSSRPPIAGDRHEYFPTSPSAASRIPTAHPSKPSVGSSASANGRPAGDAACGPSHRLPRPRRDDTVRDRICHATAPPAALECGRRNRSLNLVRRVRSATPGARCMAIGRCRVRAIAERCTAPGCPGSNRSRFSPSPGAARFEAPRGTFRARGAGPTGVFPCPTPPGARAGLPSTVFRADARR